MKVSCLSSHLPCFIAPTRKLTIRSRLTFLTENAKYSRELEAAVDVVHRACRLCVEVQKRLFSKERGVLEKGDRTPVTVADFGVQALISMGYLDGRCNISGGAFLLGDSCLLHPNIVDEANPYRFEELGRLFPSIPLVAEEDSSQLRLDLENFQQNDASDSLVEAVMNAVTNSQSLQGEELNYKQILKAIDRGGQVITSEEKSGTYWVLDPIDGTRGFVRGGKALYVVGLALVVEGMTTLGVMGCPNWDAESTYVVQNLAKEIRNKDELEDFVVPGIIMAAYYGYGTWINKISCNSRNVALDGSNNGWSRCTVDTCDSFQAARFCIADRETWELLPLSKNIAVDVSVDGAKSWNPTIVPTCCGSLCKYMMVAAGRASVFLLQVTKQSSVKVWDHAVGIICVLEAGGEVTNWDGSSLTLSRDGDGRRIIIPRGGGILVTNKILHNKLLHKI